MSLTTIAYSAFYMIIAFLFYTFVSGFMGMLDTLIVTSSVL